MQSQRRIVAYSGGLGSFETARLMSEQYGAANIECVFTDTRTEDEDLYRFLHETIDYLGCQFTYLDNGQDVWDVYEAARFMGNSRIDPCSRVLKRERFARYLDESKADPLQTTIYYGIQAHEKHRLIALVERWAPYSVEAPLINTETTKELILGELDRIGIDPPRLYELGFEHNNCGGFCCKTGQRQMAHLLKVMPERYAWHEARQEALFAKIGQHGFIRKITHGETQYLSLKDFRLMVEHGETIQRFADGACACFS